RLVHLIETPAPDMWEISIIDGFRHPRSGIEAKNADTDTGVSLHLYSDRLEPQKPPSPSHAELHNRDCMNSQTVRQLSRSQHPEGVGRPLPNIVFDAKRNGAEGN